MLKILFSHKIREKTLEKKTKEKEELKNYYSMLQLLYSCQRYRRGRQQVKRKIGRINLLEDTHEKKNAEKEK